MIIGSGMMANAFSQFSGDARVLVFASGVSNSLETNSEKFSREKNLLLKARTDNPDKLLVYFGTCSICDPDRLHTPYVVHKMEMERLLAETGGDWIVFRLPLAIGPGHRGATLAQFLYERISRGQSFDVWTRAIRYPIDVADAYRIANRILNETAMWGRSINVALRAFSVLEFVRAMEQVVGREAVCNFIEKGQAYQIPCPEVEAVAADLDLDYSEQYLPRVLRKYFGPPSRTEE